MDRLRKPTGGPSRVKSALALAQTELDDHDVEVVGMKTGYKCLL
jgi:hypothetical protein